MKTLSLLVRYRFHLLGCSVFCLSCATVSTAEEYITRQQVQTLAHQHNLATHSQWHELIHYRRATFSLNKESQADDSTFFLSENGKYDPKAELMATIDAFFSGELNDNHAICQFPARFHWLTRTLELSPEVFPSPKCTELNEWMTELDTESITLVFASSYLNSPSSMFGHTFLRLNQKQQSTDNLLLAHTISYAADAADHDNELMFAYRGIFGGYPGITAVTPYYEKIKIYTDLENRDIWEYKLNLTTSEVKQLLFHAWEIKERNFDYFFFDENCAYRILALLDVARPDTRLIDHFPLRAIPSDTVKAVVSKSLVESVEYRPSSATVLKFKLSQLTPEEARINQQIINGELDANQVLDLSLSDLQKARILDSTYDYLRYITTERELPREKTAKTSHQLLLARSQLEISKPLVPPRPEKRDDQGHETLRLGAQAGQSGNNQFIEFSIRPAYHDLTDPIAGYREGSQLRFLDTSFRYYFDNDKIDLEEFTAIEIISLSPIDNFFTPLSWQVGTGGRNLHISEKSNRFAPFIEGGVGATYPVFGGLLYTFANATLEITNKAKNHVFFGPSIHSGWIYQGKHHSTKIATTYDHFIDGAQRNKSEIAVSERISVNQKHSLVAKWSRKRDFSQFQNQWSVGWYFYY
ncbi:MAG: hypothetical protein CSA50_06805 [Gammaproteobacteria bacterium]|nr:MAG: hypothetical protein CSA50_06805 [Gammaproteobacteria bacterium]